MSADPRDPAGPEAAAPQTEPEPAPSSVRIPSGERVSAGPLPEPSQALGEARAQAPAPWDAVVVSSFGGPEGQDDVLPFLRNVTRGRGIPDDRLEAVAGHYRANGGVSPINDQNRALRAALEAELRDRGIDLPVLWANRNWTPYVGEVLAQLHEQGRDRVLVLATSAFSGYSSCRQYREDWGIALAEQGLTETMTLGKLRQHFDLEGFLSPIAQGLREGLHEMSAVPGDGPVRVLFAAHSVPDADALASGPESMRESFTGGSAYVDQLLSASRAVMERVRADPGTAELPEHSWDLVFQSRSGSPRTPWLEPDVNDAVEAAADSGARAVVIVPIGFVSDHMEVLWDLDTEARDTARGRGMGFVRTPTPGTHPEYVAGLADLLEQRMAQRPEVPRISACSDGTWFDDCPSDCCVKILRGQEAPQPTIAQLPPQAAVPVGVDGTGAVLTR